LRIRLAVATPKIKYFRLPKELNDFTKTIKNLLEAKYLGKTKFQIVIAENSGC